MKGKDKLEGLRQLRQNARGQEDFLRSAADEGLIVSFGEGRRLWHQLEPKETEKTEEQDEG